MEKIAKKLILQGKNRGKGYLNYLGLKESLIELKPERLRKLINDEADKKRLSFEWKDYGMFVSWLLFAFPPKKKDFVNIFGNACIASDIHGSAVKEVIMNDLVLKQTYNSTKQIYNPKERIEMLKLILAYKELGLDEKKELELVYNFAKEVGLERGKKLLNLDGIRFLHRKEIESNIHGYNEKIMDPEIFLFALKNGLRGDTNYAAHLYHQKMVHVKGFIDMLYMDIEKLEYVY